MPLDVLNYYCDCSSYIGDNKYAVVGGVAVKAQFVPNIEGEIQSLKSDIGMRSEFKWSAYKGGPRKERAYKGLVDLFYDSIADHKLHFHALIVDFETFDHHKIGRGSPHQSVNKLYYQHMLHDVCRRYGDKWRIQMFPDHGNDSEQIVNFREAICAKSYNQHRARPNCLRSIHPTASKKVGLLQMADVAIGVLAAERENRKVKESKADLRSYFMSKCPVPDLAIDTTNTERRFSIWNFEFT